MQKNLTEDENQYHPLFKISMPVAFNADILRDTRTIVGNNNNIEKTVSDFPPRQSAKRALFHSEPKKKAAGYGRKEMFFCVSSILL